MPKRFTPPWVLPEWRVQVDRWLEHQLARLGRTKIAPVKQVHVQPWSTVLRVPTSQGDLFFKAGGPTQHFEPALLRLLNERRPADVLPLLAADVARGWSLLPDGGQTLRTARDGNPDIAAWKEILHDYAKLQIASADWHSALISLGVPDHRLNLLAPIYTKILSDPDVLLVGEGEDWLIAEQHARLLEIAPTVQEMFTELASFGIPSTLEHGDLHDANIFVHGAGYRIFDWGDAAITHPFFTLLIPLRFTAYKLGIDEYDPDPRLLEIRDAYLDAWKDFASFDQILKAWELAHHLAKFVRTINWYRVVKTTGTDNGSEHRSSVSGWFLEFLKHPTKRFED